MKIAIFDDILERHVRASLCNALKRRGHDVIATPPVWRGHHFPVTEEQQQAIWRALEDILALTPDVLFTFRASALTPDMVQWVRGRGVHTMVWLPDDPVLYKVCYQRIVECYDTVLHCGDEKVLQFYRERHQVVGINMPFWTGSEFFPYRYAAQNKVDALFLGHCFGPVRKHRYGIIAQLPCRSIIYGNVEDDPQGISGGNIKDIEKVAEVLSGAKLAINIPQFFRDYQGLEYDFPELSSFGSFQFPSRVIQYAAVGLPIITYGLPKPLVEFPEMLVASDLEELNQAALMLLNNPEKRQTLSTATYQRFQKCFSAESRAVLLEYVLDSCQTWRGADVATCAGLFANVSERV